MEKTKDDGQRSAYSDSLKRRYRTMRELLGMGANPVGDPQTNRPKMQADEKPIGQ